MSEPDLPRSTSPHATTLGEPCPRCGQRGVWSSLDPSALYVPPPGHTVRRLDGDGLPGVTVDTCPQDPRR